MASTDSIMVSFMNYLYSTLTDGKEEFDSRNAQERFITWCLPGIPIAAKELRFASRGLSGEGTTDEEREADARLLAVQAANFARLVDFVPEMTGVFGETDQELVAFHRTEKTLSGVYGQLLTMSQVINKPLTAEEDALVDRLNKALYEVSEEEDPISGKKVATFKQGPMLRAYLDFSRKFELAFDEFNELAIAKDKGIPGATNTFTVKGPLARKKVEFAMKEWQTAGHKEKVEEIQATVAQITGRSLVKWKDGVVNRFDACRRMDDSRTDYFTTTLIPGNFIADEAGFATREFSHEHVEKHTQGTSTQFSMEGGLNLKFSFAAKGGFTKETESTHDTLSKFTLKFKVAQIPLSRPWFDPAFLESKTWRIKPGTNTVNSVSDGGDPANHIAPKGDLPAYPTSAIFVKDVEVQSEEMSSVVEKMKKTIEAGGSVGWGPFKLGGNYKRGTQTFDQVVDTKNDGFKVSGLQIIGFRCHLLKKAPDPVPGVPESDWI